MRKATKAFKILLLPDAFGPYIAADFKNAILPISKTDWPADQEQLLL